MYPAIRFACEVFVLEINKIRIGSVDYAIGSANNGLYTKLVDWTCEEDSVMCEFNLASSNSDIDDYRELIVEGYFKPSTETTNILVNITFDGGAVWTSVTGPVFIKASKSGEYGVYAIGKYSRRNANIVDCDYIYNSINYGSTLNVLKDALLTTARAFNSNGSKAGNNTNDNDLGVIGSPGDFKTIKIGSYRNLITAGSQIKIWGRKK